MGLDISALKEIAFAATKIAAEKAIQGKEIIKDTISTVAGATVAETAENIVKKTGLVRTNRYGERVLNLPFFRNSDEKIENAFAEHPERDKVCFHFTNSIRNGVKFYDPEGNVTFEIKTNKNNLKHLELYQGERYVGRIDKHTTINLNPLVDIQKYDAIIRNSTGMVLVNSRMEAKIDFASWSMEHKFGGNFIIWNNQHEEAGKVYALGFANFVLDYDQCLDPAELILALMAIMIRREEVHEHHLHHHKGKAPFEDLIADLKDIF